MGTRHTRSTRLAPRPSDRRGVLLLVVLAMLVLFMLIGTAFLMSSSQYRDSSKAAAKLNSAGNYPTDLLDRGLMQVLRDTNNPQSAVRYHSLLRDMYGVDGFQGIIYSPLSTVAFNSSVPAAQVTRYAAGTDTVGEELGPSEGQLIDIYVRALGYTPPNGPSLDDPATTIVESSITPPLPPDSRHVLKLERDVSGRPQIHNLPLTRGYYNGCLLTVTSGPAQGQSTRIVDYQYIADIPPSTTGANPVVTRLFRFRVLAFPRADGQPLQVDLSSSHNPEIVELAGARFIVNGRPFNGTGVGYNPMAQAAPGGPRLSAVETMAIMPSFTDYLHAEIALTPNAGYFFPSDITTTPGDLRGVFSRPPFPDYALNPKVPAGSPAATRAAMLSGWKYPTFAGPGDTDESYDAADFQNMFLAWQTVSPRARGRVVHDDSAVGSYNIFNPDDPAVLNNTSDFLRLDLEDLPLPSFHRPELFNYWLHRCVFREPFLVNNVANEDDRVRAFLKPYNDDGITPSSWASNPAVAAQIATIKRKIMLRPLREDHPRFDGGNASSRAADLSGVNPLVRGAGLNANVAVPYWEAIGPWDVDNDNDSVPDSVWVDLGDPVQQAEDGTLYKPLYAFLIVDLDSRLNVNAHGLAEHILPESLASTFVFPDGNLAHDIDVPPVTTLGTSDKLAHGIGYGPAEINLRSIFRAPWMNTPPLGSETYESNRLEDYDGDGQKELPSLGERPVDDYACLLAGRVKSGGSGGIGRELVPGRYGFDPITNDDYTTFRFDAAAGVTNLNSANGFFGAPDITTIFKYHGYPNSLADYLGVVPQPNAFGTPPDLAGRYSLGLDFAGQPAYEYAVEPIDRPLVADAPYELDLSSERRRDQRADKQLMLYNAPTGETQYYDEMGTLRGTSPSPAPPLPVADTDDAPFATAELERILRAHDAEAGAVPSRLWDVVAAFDPVKLLESDPYRVLSAANDLFRPDMRNLNFTDEPQLLTAAQQLADVNRRLVTTDSYDLPVPSQNMPSWVSEFGPDGGPGFVGVDDDPDGTSGPLTTNGTVDDAVEIGTVGSDDFQAVIGTPLNQATLVDLLRYRIFLEYIRQQGWTPPFAPADIALARFYAEFVLNGERFTDANNNGVWDTGETYFDAVAQGGNNNGRYDPPLLPPTRILAPELVAGQRMDINRPFGDGRDNGDLIDNDGNGLVDDPGEARDGIDDDTDGTIDEPDEGEDQLLNGIVDEPLEAGEPFLDVMNANGDPFPDGKWNPGEPFVDVLAGDADNDGNDYDGPRDHLWDGLTGEDVTFDYTNGQGVPLHPSLFVGGVPIVPGGVIPYAANVRNLNSQARQLYARQLYVLMMLLVDENFLETPDVPSLGGTNINNEWLLEAVAAANGRSTPNDADRIETMRRLKARQIAQWAVNCVDFRDADAIMTPFEYDSNPWDGWGCPDGNGVNIPLDGDPATDENQGQVIDWPEMLRSGSSTKLVVDNKFPKPDKFWKQTRGVVWGAERPELLITETLAFHDRRCTRESLDPKNYDLDQRLKPRGSLFVELYNPWSRDGQEPAELYDRVDVDPVTAGMQPSEPGVMLNKLSDVGVAGKARNAAGVLVDVVKQSPVWRMMVLRDPINGSLTNQVIEISKLSAPSGAAERQAYSTQFLQSDPDGYSPVGLELSGERWVYFNTGGDVRRNDDDTFAGDYSGFAMTDDNIGLWVWVPPVPSMKFPKESFPDAAGKRYFIARTDRTSGSDVPIAPILPGRFAVVGSSGLQYGGAAKSGGVATPAAKPGTPTTRFITPISRLIDPSGADQRDSANKRRMGDTRRIELWPSPDPQAQQLMVGENGGQEFVRTNAATYANLTDGDLDGVPGWGVTRVAQVDSDGNTTPDKQMIEPPVAIPVEDMNISEPIEGYPSRYYRKRFDDNGRAAFDSLPGKQEAPTPNAEGELELSRVYDHPLDLEFELVRNGTTQNYKSVHLQRLADPTMPWNPPPYLADGKSPPTPNPRHQPNLPVNPYLTIDSMSTDLTAYNGASILERSDQPNNAAEADTALKPYNFTNASLQGDFFAPLQIETLLYAPDHVLWAINYILFKQEKITTQSYTPKDLRDMIENQPGTVRGWFRQLEINRGGDANLHDELIRFPRLDAQMPPRHWDGDWAWSLIHRVLPDDKRSGTLQTTGEFKQRLHMKSLERGGHYQTYYKWPGVITEGWWFDTRWEPRLLWKQERPNVMLFLKDSVAGTPAVRATDLKNVRSRRVLEASSTVPYDNFSTDDQTRANYMKTNLAVLKTNEEHVFDYVLEQTLGFTNEAYAPELDRENPPGTQVDRVALISNQKPGAPEIIANNFPQFAKNNPDDLVSPQQEELNTWNTDPVQEVLITPNEERGRRETLTDSTYPWLAWNDRPFVSQNELMQVPAANSSLMLRQYSTANYHTGNAYNGTIQHTLDPNQPETALRLAIQQAPFGHLLNYFMSSTIPATATTPAGVPELTGGPNYSRILDYVEVPSRYVGTETLLAPAVFNDDPTINTVIDNIADPGDPRYYLQPPFNKVSRQRDPGRVNLNTVAGRRMIDYNNRPIIWSEVYDGLMHRYPVLDANGSGTQRLIGGDSNLVDPASGDLVQMSHTGPAWRDVALSRRGYAQFNADGTSVDKPYSPTPAASVPDTMQLGLNSNFPTFFANPFRSPDAGDLVPLAQMVETSAQASWLRSHHYARGDSSAAPYTLLATNPFASVVFNALSGTPLYLHWGQNTGSPQKMDDDGDGVDDDIREAGYAHDGLVVNLANGALGMSGIPLFSETMPMAAVDGERNPYNMYQPMTRLGNMVTGRSNVYAIWMTVGYFEVEPAPDWNDPTNAVREAVRRKFGASNQWDTSTDPATIAARALYDRVYPEGYALAQEMGSATGDVRRERAFYIIDRTRPVAFKPGEDLNVEDIILVRRRIE